MEQLQRLELQIKKQNIEKIKNSCILIVGLGGVGSYATESLVRSGIGKIIIVDKDVIDITNLNRQLMSLHSNIGEDKVEVWKKRINDINPNCEVIPIKSFITKENINDLFKYHIDYVVDACDTIETKKALVKECINRKIKIISSMGTGNKLDPSQLKIMDIRKTSYDPIAKILRKMFKDEKIKEKYPVVCSFEKPIKIESKTISSNSFVPATSGLLITSYIINDIIDKEVIYEKK
jgi:tRNA A37 threonylcarbamoyladenosine dehydratase